MDDKLIDVDAAQEEVLGPIQSIFSQALKALPATFLPIYGFWATTLPYMKKYADWYNASSKPTSLEVLAETGLLRGLMKADRKVVEVNSEVKSLERKLDNLKTKRKGIEIGERKSRPQSPTGIKRQTDSSPSREEKLRLKTTEVLNAKKVDLKNATAQAQEIANAIHACRNEFELTHEDGRPGDFSMPLIYWIMTATNVGVGLASYLVWDATDGFEEYGQPLVAYGTQLALYWTYYPALFHFGSLEWSLIHIGLTTIAAVITTIQFTKISDAAGLLMMPYLFYMAHSVHHNYTVGVDTWNQTQMNRKISQLLRRYATVPGQSSSN